jgi:DNA-binding LacI/PurR family transcriptional regulator
MKEAIKWCHASGFRRMVTVGIDPRSAYGRQRIRGIQRGCQESGWTFDQDVLQFVAHDSKGDFSDGAYFASEFLRCCEAPFPPVIALNDRVAVGMIQALRGAGVRVPVDVSVIGYDNADFSAYSDPPLTTIDPRVDILIRRAVAHLLPANGASEPKRILVRPQIIFRQSTADTSDRTQRP